ncbi:hypothetical protein PI126_g3391 [Phytophthora idaei]|nr:hypothetical protein PI126_g3391 [Phytophthora idaei]
MMWLLQHFSECEAPFHVSDTAAEKGQPEALKLLNSYKFQVAIYKDAGGYYSREVAVKTMELLEKDVMIRKLINSAIRKLINSAKSSTDIEVELAKLLVPPAGCILDYVTERAPPEMIQWLLDSGYLQRRKTCMSLF